MVRTLDADPGKANGERERAEELCSANKELRAGGVGGGGKRPFLFAQASEL